MTARYRSATTLRAARAESASYAQKALCPQEFRNSLSLFGNTGMQFFAVYPSAAPGSPR